MCYLFFVRLYEKLEEAKEQGWRNVTNLSIQKIETKTVATKISGAGTRLGLNPKSVF